MAASAPSPSRVERWRGVRKLLAVRLDNLGDVLMSTPALGAIRHSLPDARISLLASPASTALAAHLPVVDEFIPFAAPWVKAMPSELAEGAAVGEESRLIERLRLGGFDAAVIFTVCTQSALPAALACRLAGIPLRLAHVRENPYGLLSDWVPDRDVVADGMRHEVERQLALVAVVGFAAPDDRLVFALRDPDRTRARLRLDAAGLPPGARYFVVHPGASAPSRRYPAERFGQAADRIARASGCLPVYTGGGDEAPLIEAARACMTGPSLNLAGRLGLGELGAVIERAELLVANNTGPVHVAAALGTPVVDLYALTNPQHTPWKVASRVLYRDVPCRFCLKSECPEGHHACLRGVAPEDVANAAAQLLAARPLGTATEGVGLPS